MRAVVVGASSGLGRCIGVGLAQRGARTALLARREDRLLAAADEAGAGTLAIRCDVTDEDSCFEAVEEAARGLGGIDALVYAPAIGPLARLADLDAATWRSVFDTNVIGASVVTAAALPHLTESGGTAVYLSSVSASVTAPWPGLGSYAVSKAALDKLVEALRVEHPTVGFTRLVVGECMGGEGDAMSGFATAWDPDLAVALGTQWVEGNLMSGSFVDVEALVAVVDSLLRHGGAVSMHSVTVAARTGSVLS
ncbi:MAG TPA: SDR family oxidoreductase [Acidimicrobiales bacterium]|nr:SDR family oxidoreductase [Acidimicrobiales bacterium]